MTPNLIRLAAVAAILALPDAPDLAGRGHRLTQPGAAQRHLLALRYCAIHLAQRRLAQQQDDAAGPAQQRRRIWRVA